MVFFIESFERFLLLSRNLYIYINDFFQNTLIRHVSTGLCVHSYGAYAEALLTVAECRRTDIHFKWQWEFVRESTGEYRKYFY